MAVLQGYREERGQHAIELVPLTQEEVKKVEKVNFASLYRLHSRMENFFFTILVVGITLFSLLVLAGATLSLYEMWMMQAITLLPLYMMTVAHRKMRLLLIQTNQELVNISEKLLEKK